MKKVKWGVLGTAGIAKGCTIPGMLEAENCDLYAIAGRNPEKTADYQKTFGFQKGYYSYEELLADPDVEAVYIPLPNQLHYEWVMKAIEAGKHVLCEKPLAPTAAQAEELFCAAKEKGVFLMEAFAYLHSPYVEALREEIARQSFGEVRFIETAFLTSDYDLSNIRMQKDCFGGAAYDLGCYCTSMILRMIGKLPEKVQAVAEYTEGRVDNLTTAILKFEGDVRASFLCGMNLETGMDRRMDRLYIHGSRGYIKSGTEYNEAGELSYTLCVDGKETVKTVNAPQNYRLEIEQMGRCITEGEKPHVSSEFSVMNAKVLDQVLKAIAYSQQ